MRDTPYKRLIYYLEQQMPWEWHTWEFKIFAAMKLFRLPMSTTISLLGAANLF